MTDQPELLNASRDTETVAACVEGSVEHDYREWHDKTVRLGERRVYLRCVWCHAVACGYVGQPDPCIEPWHHEPKPHRTKAGVTWPIGGTRPDQETR